MFGAQEDFGGKDSTVQLMHGGTALEAGPRGFQEDPLGAEGSIAWRSGHGMCRWIPSP